MIVFLINAIMYYVTFSETINAIQVFSYARKVLLIHLSSWWHCLDEQCKSLGSRRDSEVGGSEGEGVIKVDLTSFLGRDNR